MPTYRLYAIDRQNHIVSGADFQSESDVAAVAYAGNNLRPRCSAEIWEGPRCVGRIAEHPTPDSDVQHKDVSSPT
jgi:hypothetical protein